MIRCPVPGRTTLRAIEFARALLYPVLSQTVLFAFVMFYLIAEFVRWAATTGPFFFISGIIVAGFILPALSLYLISLLDARAKGREPEPPGVEHLHWFGSGWSLLQVLYYSVIAYAAYKLASLDGAEGIIAVVVLVAVVLPASLATLAVTHSPLESLHPITIGKVIRRCGGSYWIAPVFLLLAAERVWSLWNSSLPGWLVDMVSLYLLFVFYALTGAVMQPQRLHEEVDIHAPLGPDDAQVTADLNVLRTDVLNHAYGFISRGNRDGGFKHIHNWIADDPEPDSAWQWYFDQMMRWKDPTPALFFGQHYIARLLHDGDFHAATKIITRCRFENEAFKPFREDLEKAIAAAAHVGNEELARALRAGMS